MSADGFQAESVEWRIETSYGEALSVGTPGPEILGYLFAMWLHDKEDVSEWDCAPLLGAIVVEYSDLSLPVVAVWLGIGEHEIERVATPRSGPPWQFEGPDGGRAVLEREIR